MAAATCDGFKQLAEMCQEEQKHAPAIKLHGTQIDSLITPSTQRIIDWLNCCSWQKKKKTQHGKGDNNVHKDTIGYPCILCTE
jgi:hypothetical protein